MPINVKQVIIQASKNYVELENILREYDVRSLLLVCDSAFRYLKISSYFDALENTTRVRIVKFDDFKSNPLYESVVKGVRIFRESNCDMIIAVGGGSAMDVAKCIKLYAYMDSSTIYLKQRIVPNNITLMAVPTTAGTGSEATRYAVIYYEGEKQSVSDYSCIPSIVLMDASVLKTLPEYQKKSAMMDALCHAIESYWSVHSNEESRGYSQKAISLILQNMNNYLANDDKSNSIMLYAAYFAGKAINITQTTAGHAMCYKMTSLYGIAHGHAAALCTSKLWSYMINAIDDCLEPRGKGYLEDMFAALAQVMGGNMASDGSELFDTILTGLQLHMPTPKDADFEILKNSVNQIRLKNNPVALNIETIDLLYHRILGAER